MHSNDIRQSGLQVVNGLVLIGIVVMSLLNRDALVQASITDEDQSTIRFVFLASALYTFTPLFLGSKLLAACIAHRSCYVYVIL